MPAALKTDAERLHDANEIIRRKIAETNDLRKLVDSIRKENDTAEMIRREIWGLSEHTPAPPSWVSGKGGKIGQRGAPITIWSDWHYGEVVDPEQTGGINTYNKAIARKRAYRLFDTIVDLSLNHMGRANTEYPGIVVCLGGDMVGGDIHEELAWTNDRTSHQAVNDLTDIIAAGLEKMASAFGKVFCPVVVGNHGRSTKRLPMKNRVYTNYDWSIGCNLERYFRKDKRIAIHVPNEADCHFNSFGTRYLLTHGDSLGVKGGDGIIGALGPIMRGTIKLRNSEMQIGNDFDMVLMGHWHQLLWLPGCIVNNSLKGYDEYTRLGLRAPASRPSQALWFNHPEHGITARWEVFLEGKEAVSTKNRDWITWAA
jgi:hypothetical protein